MEILGLGTAVPAHTMEQNEAAAMLAELVCDDGRQARLLRSMFRNAGVETRHTCVPSRTIYEWSEATESELGPSTADRMATFRTHAGPLALEASTRALDAAKVAADRITHLVTVSCSGFHAPGVDVELIEALGLSRTVDRVHVGFMGCHGAINGLRVARGLATSDPNARILVCAVELCSLHLRFRWDPELVLGNALFADGAAALVARPDAMSRAAGGETHPARLVATGSCLIADSQDAMGWTIGDHGFEMLLTKRVAELIERDLRGWLEAWLDANGTTLASVRSWAVHPGGPRILAAVEGALDLPPDALRVSRDVLAAFGNMSSPTVLFILDRLLAQDVPRPLVALAFGPGVTAEVAMIA